MDHKRIGSVFSQPMIGLTSWGRAAAAGLAIGLAEGWALHFPDHWRLFSLPFAPLKNLADSLTKLLLLASVRARLPINEGTATVLSYALAGAAVGALFGLGLARAGHWGRAVLSRPLVLALAAGFGSGILLSALWIYRNITLPLVLLFALSAVLSLWAIMLMVAVGAIKRSIRRWPWAAAIATVLLLGGLGWNAARAPHLREEKASSGPFLAPHPVLLIGIDAVSWHNLEPLIEAGRLEHLGRLRSKGAWGELRSLRGTKSPVIWTTIVTGVSPQAHGIVDFHQNGVPYTSNSRRVPAVWEVLPRYGQRSAFFYWWASWPAEEIDGLIVTDRFQYRDLPARVFPDAETAAMDAEAKSASERAPTVASLLGPGGDLQDPAFVQRHQVRLETLREFLERDEIVASLGEAVLARQQFNLVGVYLRGADAAGHKFWKWHYRRCFPLFASWLFGPPDADQAALEGVVDGMNEVIDRKIGRLLEAADPDTNVIVVSDHGMTAESTTHHRKGETANETGSHHRSGLLLLAGPDIRRGARVRAASVYDVLPTLLFLLGLPVPEDLPGRVLVEALADQVRSSRAVLRIDSFGLRATADRAPIPTKIDREYMERLKALGYLHN